RTVAQRARHADRARGGEVAHHLAGVRRALLEPDLRRELARAVALAEAHAEAAVGGLAVHVHADGGKQRVADAAAVARAAGRAGAPADLHRRRRDEAELFVVGGDAVDVRAEEPELLRDDLERLRGEVAV